VNHVFVETNFLIDVARPFPSPDATDLLARSGAGGDVTLYVPWVSIAEAKRTLDRIIREDLGFTDSMLKFAVREFRDSILSSVDKQIIDALSRRAKVARKEAIQGIASAVDDSVAQAVVIEPSKPVVEKVLNLFAVKSLKPFDEMVLGAVLTKALELHKTGERSLWFCNLNTKDFDPANQAGLTAEYAASGLKYLSSFAVPT
jgi:hypothetical protein